jgi:hypothetical protein
LPILQKLDTFKARGNEMAAKFKLVQPMEIKDKKIAHEAIEQIRKPYRHWCTSGMKESRLH